MPGLAAGRVNQAALSAGAAAVASPANAAIASSPQLQQLPPEVAQTPAADRLKRQVNIANAQSSQQRMPSEQEMLMDEVQGYSAPDETAFYGS